VEFFLDVVCCGGSPEAFSERSNKGYQRWLKKSFSFFGVCAYYIVILQNVFGGDKAHNKL
jgi:hypothetical protein